MWDQPIGILLAELPGMRGDFYAREIADTRGEMRLVGRLDRRDDAVRALGDRSLKVDVVIVATPRSGLPEEYRLIFFDLPDLRVVAIHADLMDANLYQGKRLGEAEAKHVLGEIRKTFEAAG